MVNTVARWMAISALILVARPLLVAQQPLPADMTAQFALTNSFAEKFWLPAGSPANEIIGRVSFDNTLGSTSVTLHWQFHSGSAATRSTEQRIDVSFQPTAVARRAGTTNVLYVVGWTARAERVIVETWTMTEYLLGAALNENTGTEISVLSLPHIDREVEWVSNATALYPVWDAVFQVYANDLLLLESGTPTRIMSLDLDSRLLSEVYNSATTGLGQLAGHRQFSIGKFSPTGGAPRFVAFTERRKVWEVGTDYMASGYVYYVMTDDDLNGTFDTTSFLADADFVTAFPATWDLAYTP